MRAYNTLDYEVGRSSEDINEMTQSFPKNERVVVGAQSTIVW